MLESAEDWTSQTSSERSDSKLPNLNRRRNGEDVRGGLDFERLQGALQSSKYTSGSTHNFYLYPARFSPEIARSVIDIFSEPGDCVLDPFMGGGTAIIEGLALAGIPRMIISKRNESRYKKSFEFLVRVQRPSKLKLGVTDRWKLDVKVFDDEFSGCQFCLKIGAGNTSAVDAGTFATPPRN